MDNREIYISTLKQLGGRASNKVMFNELSKSMGWEANYYTNVKMALKDEGLIKFGRGRGGTVMLTEQENNVGA